MKPVHLFLFFLAGVLFLAFYSILAFHNRFAADDYFWMYLLKKNSVINATLILYKTWTGRWAAMFLLNLIYVFVFAKMIPIYAINTLGFLSFVMAFWILLCAVNKRVVASHTKASLLGVSVMFSIFYFFLSTDNGEIWFWMCSSIQYLWSIILFIFIVAFIIYPGKSVPGYIGMVGASIYIGGASESFAFIYLLIGVVFIAFSYRNKILRNDMAFSKILVALPFVLLSYSFNFFSKGNKARETCLPIPAVGRGIEMAIKSCFHLLTDFWLNHLLALICFIPLFIFLGMNSLQKEMNKKPLGKSVISIFFIAVILIMISLFIPSYILSDIAPERSLAITYFLIGLFVFCVSVIYGTTLKRSELYKTRLGYFSVSAVILLIVMNTFIQIPIVAKYSEACDNRIAGLLKVNQTFKGKVYSVLPLPPSGMLFSSEISADTSYYRNKHLKIGLGLKFNVVKRK